MKKLVFLLLMAFALVGFVSTGAAHPPGAYSLDMAEILIAEYDVQMDVVTQHTVLAMEMPVTADPSSLQAVLANDNFSAIQPHNSYINDYLVDYQSRSSSTDFYLRL